MILFGLIGYPLFHSFSSQYFYEKFFREGIHDTRYELFPISTIEQLLPLIKEKKELKGLNITTPYKESVLPFLDFIDPIAKEIGAINTVRIERRKKLILHGFNTDVFGLEESIKPLLLPQHKRALILGTGGASKAAGYVLKKTGIDYSFVSGKMQETSSISSILAYSDLDNAIISSHLLIINASPVGMFPNLHEAPDIPYQFITKDHLLFDLVYNPAETLFMKKGIEKGATVSNGLKMLHIQAEKSWEIWNI
jgi:shikimate dehydrogenase